MGSLERGRKDRLDTYTDLAADRCGQVLRYADELAEPSRSLYEGAATACLAAFHGEPALWSRAQTALADVQPRAAELDCLDTPVHLLLQSLVEQHEQFPGARFSRTFDTAHTGPCPRVLRLIPDHGPREGGYPVRLLGVNLPPTVGVHFGSHDLTVATSDGREAVVIAPPANPREKSVSVWVDGWPFGAEVTPRFAYARQRSGGNPSATPSPTTR